MSKIKVCTHCGFTLEEVYSRRILGCAQCYSTFSQELKSILAVLHNHIRHLSEAEPSVSPDNPAAKFEKIAQLRDLLSKAVRQEKFEEALRIKKEIRLLELENGSD